MRSAASELGHAQQSVVTVVARAGGRRGTTPPRWRARAARGASPLPGPRFVGRQRSPFFHDHCGVVLPSTLRSCPQERPQVWRSCQHVLHRCRPGRARDSPGKFAGRPGRRPSEARQRSTGVLVRQGVAGFSPDARPARVDASRVARAGSGPYTRRFRLPRGPLLRAARGHLEEALRLKRTYQPNNRKRAKTHGFRLRMRTQGRPSRAARPPGPRPEASLGLIWRVRDRATFEALARARRHRAGPVSLRFLTDGSDDPPRVAYAIGRRVGIAVERNRTRRRLRAPRSALARRPPAPGRRLSLRRGAIGHDAPLRRPA